MKKSELKQIIEETIIESSRSNDEDGKYFLIKASIYFNSRFSDVYRLDISNVFYEKIVKWLKDNGFKKIKSGITADTYINYDNSVRLYLDGIHLTRAD